MDLFAFEFPFAQTLGARIYTIIYNVLLEPERAAKARRAVVASLSFLNLKLLLVDDYALELRT